MPDKRGEAKKRKEIKPKKHWAKEEKYPGDSGNKKTGTARGG